ncbi:family 10 glycosylhydrolase [bacterium]|nr:family 10 glycosylhydrolase [bacterium]MCP5462142.1 family 10 glycosylhydrolase [bacterium]
MKYLFGVFYSLLCIFYAVLLHAAPSMGLWVECQGSEATLDSKKAIDEMLEDAVQMHIDTLFIQLHRGNRAWFDSSLADSTPYKAFFEKEKTDLVTYILNNAKQRGMQVHLWVNTFRLLKNKDAKIIQEFGTKIITRDGKKRLMLDYPNEDLPDGGYWLDAGDIQVQEYLRNLFLEALEKYPQCDGLHLDFVRYPYRVPFYPGSQWAAGHGFGYGVDSVNRFKKKTGLDPFTMELTRENAELWDNWRRDQVTQFVRSINTLCKERGKMLSVAGICWADRAYLSAFQDWRGWLEEGIVDFVATMNYGTDQKFARYLSREAIVSRGEKRVFVGLGAYLLKEKPDVLAGQIDDAVRLGADGLIIFSYDAVKKSPALKNVIKDRFNRYKQ